MKRLLPLLILVLVLAASSVALTTCGGSASSDDRAFAEKFMKMWASNDAAAAKELYAQAATIFWPAPDPPVRGIDAISSTVASYPLDPMLIGDTVYTFVPSDEDMQLLNSSYKDSHFIAYPVALGRDAFFSVLELRGGKVVNMWVSYMYPFE